jgi:hypothetical protein
MTLQELETAHAKLVSGQHVVTFRSANGKSVTYNMGDLPRLEALIARMKLKEAAPKRTRTRQTLSSKGL